ncbi:phosphoribosylglycinamide formyltransferase [Halodesulfovibrio marinisediminis]|uniref:Phosphoribosylglycinamide formyltransferase n=1 Tax=Halodesulfovibrio marinisediminis DSM 17456 TaxID=1121457 RepID=A0A1N6FXN1_9BACT|nr:phosphoribosylglycinamide formyltransferase [Halodesulfovibrio marinisediminis]SIO00116.1 phosphoribosylglycinamide formyltransferase-1 [Halodesulfovibrio marinisediminis DSM 17456]
MALKIAVLASGSGSNLQSIIDAVERGSLEADIRLVLCNRSDAFALERAKKAGIPTATILHAGYENREAFDAAMIEQLQAAGADLIVLAGFMRLLTPLFIQTFSGRIINIHPALLPSFKGAHGIADAVDYGVKLAGCTVHFVDEIMDNGAIIAQAVVPFSSEESAEIVQKRVLSFEHRIYPQVLQWIATGRVTQDGRKVFVQDTGLPKVVPDGSFIVSPQLEDGF